MPRKTDITNYTLQDISDITWAVNSTPRKCLGYKTPAEAFLETSGVALYLRIQPVSSSNKVLMNCYSSV